MQDHWPVSFLATVFWNASPFFVVVVFFLVYGMVAYSWQSKSEEHPKLNV